MSALASEHGGTLRSVSPRGLLPFIGNAHSRGDLRNRLCICGSDRKFKRCCLYKLQGWVLDKEHGYWTRKGTNVAPV